MTESMLAGCESLVSHLTHSSDLDHTGLSLKIKQEPYTLTDASSPLHVGGYGHADAPVPPASPLTSIKAESSGLAPPPPPPPLASSASVAQPQAPLAPRGLDHRYSALTLDDAAAAAAAATAVAAPPPQPSDVDKGAGASAVSR
ncbi:hypothetical protein R5R35_002651 [Gryllus longicercus]|uniref:Uncharacterized protein n=1 Tax=Gryllus longicercus TaxID=2509291 RepID=A0AAN9ZGF3_9ORTH